jgi:copper chaperone
MSDIVLHIEGMHCGACVRRVTQALEHVPGLQVEEVRVGGARVKRTDPAASSQSAVDAIAKAGFTAHAE